MLLVPLALAQALRTRFPGAIHVKELGMERKTDTELWHYAREKKLVIVSKDSDFYERLSVNGFPPKLIWVRTGNVSTAFLLILFQNLHEKVKQFITDDDVGYLEIF